MQPYFVPYGGYFRLFAACDLFVLYDCVQFPRRGWVHRNQLPGHDGVLRWLTLPLERIERDAPISELRFPLDAEQRLVTQFPRFPALSNPGKLSAALQTALNAVRVTPVDYLERLLHVLCADLGIHCNTVRSSALPIDSSLRGQARIIAIARYLGAHTYVNSPGGRTLYSAEAFAASELELRFLPRYQGNNVSILQSIVEQGIDQVSHNIRSQISLDR